jgi:TonB family protein
LNGRFAVALLLFSIAASARADSAAAKLAEMLGDSSDLLKSGKYVEAMKLDDVVIREMGEYYVSGDLTTQIFTIAVVHKALACAGLGREDDALWYWYAAASLYPSIAHSDMSAYGKAGKFLVEHPPGPLEVRVPQGATIVPPSVIKKVETKYPSQSLNSVVQGPVVIEFIVGRDGRAHTPRIVGDIGAPMVAFATLEAVRQWQFSPATADGKPIDAPYRFTMNYKVIH